MKKNFHISTRLARRAWSTSATSRSSAGARWRKGKLVCAPATIRALKKNALPKGDVLTVAQIAGIQAAKRTAELIPLCHPLPLNHVQINFTSGLGD